MTKRSRIAAAAVSCALALSACGGGDDGAATEDGGSGVALTGEIQIDGSSTVAPLAEAAAEGFQEDNDGVTVAVGTSGTGGGFEKFCAGETDISNASRPIKDEEAAECEAAGIAYTEIVIANDGLAVVINPENDWADDLTVEQLNKIWAPESEGVVTSWADVDPSFPDVPLALFGAGTDSGTFDYFTGAINGEEGAIRADYSPSEDDNITVQGVAGDEGGIGFFGLSYAEENADAIKTVTVDGVLPTVETVQDGSYTPLGRPLFIYVKNDSYTDSPQVKAFVDYFVENAVAVAEAALFVPLTEEQITTAAEELASLG